MHSNPFLAALQIFVWLLFQPTRWRQSITTLNLPADFNLQSLSKTHWRHPIIRRLLIIILIILPLFVGSLVAIALYMIGRPLPNLMMSVTYGMVITMLTGFVGALWVSTAFAIVASVLSGLAIGFAYGEIGGLLTILGAIFAVGTAGSVLDNFTTTPRTPPLIRQLGSIVFGIFVSGFVLGLGGGLTWLIAKWITPQIFANSQFNMMSVQLIGSVFALSVTLRWYFSPQRWGALIFGIVLAMVMFILLEGVSYLRELTENKIILIVGTAITVGAIHSILFSSLWFLPYLIAKRLSNTLNGVIAGTLSSGGFYIAYLIYTDAYSAALIIPLSLISLLLGLTINSWRTLLFYPFVIAWHQWLVHAEKHRTGSSLLHWHAAFWDEHQHLPLFGLDNYLVQIYERDPQKGQLAIDYISHRSQNWAAKAAQIELDARRLERCNTANAIARIHHEITAGELLDQASSVLRSFSYLSQDIEKALQNTLTYYQRLAIREVQERLENLFRELSQTTYAARFQPIVHQWRQVLDALMQQLTTEVETRQEIENPYVVGNPLDEHQATFVGRHAIAIELEELLLKPACPPLLLYGQRRMGKTSLLHHLGQLLPHTIIPLFVKVQGTIGLASNSVDFLYSLSKEICKSAKRYRRLQLPLLTREVLTVGPFSVFDEWLDDVEQLVTPKRLLLMLDEFIALDYAFAQNRLDKHNILGLLRHQFQHRPHLKMLLCGSLAIEELQHWASYLVNVRTVHLSYLTEAETYQLIEAPIPNFSLRYDKEARERVLNLTRRHPALVQSLCHEIITLKNQQLIAKRRQVEIADVEAAVPQVLETVKLFFTEILKNEIDANEQRVLRHLAAAEESAVLNQTNPILSPAQWQMTLSQLLQRELIESVDGNSYRFQVELIRRAVLKW